MELALVAFPRNNFFQEAEELIREQNLVYYASEAAEEMEFSSTEEFENAIKRAIGICEIKGLPVKRNFKRIFKSTPFGIVFDWKLSLLAFELVKLNGHADNPKVAEYQVSLLKSFYSEKINH
jgi:hypothetical protein